MGDGASGILCDLRVLCVSKGPCLSLVLRLNEVKPRWDFNGLSLIVSSSSLHATSKELYGGGNMSHELTLFAAHFFQVCRAIHTD